MGENKYKEIKREYLAGELEPICAIERLEMLGLTPTDAEDLVVKWDADEK